MLQVWRVNGMFWALSAQQAQDLALWRTGALVFQGTQEEAARFVGGR